MLFKACVIVTGSLLVAVGINFFLIPHKILDGGITGIALILKYIYNLPPGLTILLCSLPIYALAWFRDRSIFLSSIHGLLVSSLLIDWLYPLRPLFLAQVQLSPLVSAIGGGTLIGSGIGLMLRHKSSTGGTDLLAFFLSGWLSINVGLLIMAMDSLVVMLGGLLFSKHTLILSVIAILAVGIATSLMTAERQQSEKK